MSSGKGELKNTEETTLQGLIQDFVMGEAKVKMEGTFAARPATHDEWGHFLRDRGHLGLTGEAMALSAYPLDQPLIIIVRQPFQQKNLC